MCPLPDYRPGAVGIGSDTAWLTDDGAVRVVGYNDMSELMDGWVRAFTTHHPEVGFELDLCGTRFAPAALAAGASAFGPMGGEFTTGQLRDYRSVLGAAAEPLMIRVAHASLHPKALSGPIAVFTHPDNPLRHITFQVLADILRGNARQWSDIPDGGAALGHAAIHPVGVRPESVIGEFVRDRVLDGRAYTDGLRAFGQSAEVVQAVAEDPLAIGYAAAMRATAGVRMLALSSSASQPAVLPTRETLRSGRYPLDRHLLIAVRLPVSALAGEFLSLVLSGPGQRTVASSSLGYLPLAAAEVAQERSKLAAAGFVCQ